ncbi:MAG: hypothetical protein U1E30_03680 [Rhodoblastus sp.]
MASDNPSAANHRRALRVREYCELYGRSRFWLYELGYRSQCENPAGRAAQRRHKIARRMGIDPECPIKPKRMRWRTFEQALDRLDRYESVWAVAVYGWLHQRLR